MRAELSSPLLSFLPLHRSTQITSHHRQDLAEPHTLPFTQSSSTYDNHPMTYDHHDDHEQGPESLGRFHSQPHDSYPSSPAGYGEGRNVT